jgi:hypothetical protein|tara:strand:- start:474 stop:662 length:189 start_codon:yes stop_codon:yes gene_type:complete
MNKALLTLASVLVLSGCQLLPGGGGKIASTAQDVLSLPLVPVPSGVLGDDAKNAPFWPLYKK